MKAALPSHLRRFFTDRLDGKGCDPVEHIERFSVKYVEDLITHFELFECAVTFLDTSFLLPAAPQDSMVPGMSAHEAQHKRTQDFMFNQVQSPQYPSVVSNCAVFTYFPVCVSISCSTPHHVLFVSPRYIGEFAESTLWILTKWTPA